MKIMKTLPPLPVLFLVLLAVTLLPGVAVARPLQVATGEAHTVTVRADGTLWAAGLNDSGQLGDGTFVNKPSPVKVGSAADWVTVAAGGAHTLGIRGDGSLWAWGNNLHGQLGNNSTTNAATPVRVGTGNDWVAVAAGGFVSLALKSNGTLWAWGANAAGQLGNGDPAPHPADRLTPVQVAGPGGRRFIASATSGEHTLAIAADGTLWSWGDNLAGQLGLGTTDALPHPTPAQVGVARNWTRIAAGGLHSAAVRGDGSLWTWGSNSSGQLGDGTTTTRTIPIQVGPDRDWAGVSAGELYTLAVKRTGTIWGWGNNAAGQLGTGSTNTSLVPAQAGLPGAATGWTAVVAGGIHAVGTTASGEMFAWGDNGSGQLGSGDLSGQTSPFLVALDAVVWMSASGGGLHTVAGKSDGTLWSWGDNSTGQLGDGTTTGRLTPGQVGTDLDWTAIDAGFGHTVAMKADGSLWSWGDDTAGQLGDAGEAFLESSPVAVAPGEAWSAVSAGDFHTLAIHADGTLWAWGDNSFGQVGDGTGTSSRPLPIQIDSLSGWTAVAGGGTHSLALKADGTLWAWGANTVGQLGTGSTIDSSFPVQVGNGTEWRAIAAGLTHSLAVKADGTLWAWGGNLSGQLGTGSTTDATAPVQIGTATTWIAVSAGDSHSLGLRSDGTLWGWGGNASGQLGIGTVTASTIPVQIGTGWRTFSAGGSHSVVITSSGTLSSWGSNTSGQLGDGTTTTRTAPNQLLEPKISVTSLVDYGVVAIPATATRTATVTNSGTGALTIASVSLAGADAAAFAISVNGCNGATLAPGASCGVTVVFTASAPTGGKTAVVEIASNDATNPVASAVLSSSAVAAVIVNSAAVGSGTISPAGGVSILPGGAVTFTITPDPGFAIREVLVDGVTRGAVSTLTLTNVTAGHTVTAVFSNTFTVTASAGAGGGVSPAGAVAFVAGRNKTFTITPDAGFTVAAVSVTENGVTRSLGPVSSYTFNDIAADGAISATFAASPLNSWRWRNPLPQGETLRRVISVGSTFVAAGDSGAIVTSADGISWTVRQTSGSAIRGLASGAGKLVAVGTGGKILLSTDGGATWNNRASAILLDLNGVAFGNGLFVAVGNTETDPDTLVPSVLILTSADGSTWTKRSQPLPLNESFDLADVAFGNGTFVAVGQGGRFITSTDGIAWSAPAEAGLTDFTGISFGSDDTHPGTFVAVATAGEIVTSTDSGATWTAQPLFSFTDLRGVGFGVIPHPEFAGTLMPVFVATGDAGTVFVSEDFGESWSNAATGLENSAKVIRGAAAAGRIVTVGDSGEIVTSDDADIWTRRLNAVTTETLRDVVRGNRTFVAVGDGGSGSAAHPPVALATIIVSTDGGATWNPATLPPSHSLRGVAYGNGFFVAAGESGYSNDSNTARRASLLTSPDGLSWTALNSGTFLNLNAALFAGDAVVVLGDYDATGNIGTEGAAVLSSADGVNWSSARVATSTAGSLRRGAYGGGVIVAVGDFGTILTSADGGATWTERTFDPFVGDFAGVAYGNGTFVAVLQGNLAYTSTDGGATWQARTLPLETTLSPGLNAVTFNYGTFVAGGNDRFILTSIDGIGWTVRAGAEYLQGTLFGLASGNGTFVAVGSGGVVQQSLPAVNPPQAFVAPTSVAAGSVLVGNASAASVITLTNAGTAPLTVSDVSLDGTDTADFALADTGCLGATVTSGGSCTVSVVFRPETSGSKAIRVLLATNDPDTPVAAVPVRGTAVESALLTVEISGNGGGKVTSAPSSIAVEGVAGASGSARFTAGAEVAVTAVPSADSVFAGWSGSGAGSCGESLTCTVALAGDRDVTASFAIKTFGIIATAGANGAISGPATAQYGDQPVFTITPNAGFKVVDVLVNGVSQGAATEFAFPPVTAPQTISATFALANTVTITAAGDENGTVSPSGAVPVTPGGSQTFTVTPKPGYHIDRVLIDGKPVGKKSEYVFSNVRKNRTLAVEFAINTYAVKVAKAGKGTVTADGSGKVAHGGNRTFTITPAAGYHISDVLVDGVSVGALSTVTLSNVTKAGSVKAVFSNRWKISVAGNAGGVAGSTFSLLNGKSKTVKFVPEPGFRVEEVIIDGVSQGAISSFTFTDVSSNHNVVVRFAPVP